MLINFSIYCYKSYPFLFKILSQWVKAFTHQNLVDSEIRNKNEFLTKGNEHNSFETVFDQARERAKNEIYSADETSAELKFYDSSDEAE
jgi:hypothetical protein